MLANNLILDKALRKEELKALWVMERVQQVVSEIK